MEHVPIAALRPNLDALDSKQIKAVVTLIWPYSSSQRHFALLLAEPDFRLRRRNGQVRARFSSTSARALAATGVSIGDEVALSLHGAQFVQDGAVSTPGKSIDWELVYTQTVAISVRRDGAEIASFDFINAAPTPAPRSPVKKSAAVPSPVPQWASPAFLKRSRLSDGPFFEQPAYDPLGDESYDAHDKKRRRKSYRDWAAWTYTARTPSPEKEDADLEGGLEDALSSPSRTPQLPKTPVSPSKTEHISVAVVPAEDSEYIEETTIADSAEGDTTVDDGELQKVHVPLTTSPERPDPTHDGAYYQLYDGPSEAPQDSQYDFGGDTELNTEDEEDEEDADEDEDEEDDDDDDDDDGNESEDEDSIAPDVEQVDASTTEAATELEDEPRYEDDNSAAITSQPILPVAGPVHLDAASATEEESDLEVIEADHLEDISIEVEGTTIDETIPEVIEPAVAVDEPIPAAMPPPTLPALHTDFTMNTGMDLLTPIGREPSSPNLKAVDSATLPLPSPFPDEQDLSYFEHVSVDQQAPLDGSHAQGESNAVNDADYIMESSFFSSINSSRAGGLHPDHETAFTPLRFTFGGDGAGWSRPLELSSPPPEDPDTGVATNKDVSASSPSPNLDAVDTTNLDEVLVAEKFKIVKDAVGSTLDKDLDVVANVRTEVEATKPRLDVSQPSTEATPVEILDDPVPRSSNLVHMSSDVESDVTEHEDDATLESEEDQSSERESESGSEDKGSSAEQESEPDDEGPDPEPTTIDESPPQTRPNEAISVSPTTGNEQQYEAATIGTQVSVAATEVIDLGSPSGSESGDAGEPELAVQEDSLQAGSDIDAATRKTTDNIRSGFDLDTTNEPTTGAALETADGGTNIELIEERISADPEPMIREPASVAIPDTYEQAPSRNFDDWEPQLGVDEPLPFLYDDNLSDVRAADASAQDVTDHADIKMESVEEGSIYLASHPETQDVPHESTTDPATEFISSIPEDGRKIGELQPKSVPATAPARNTRSKAKAAASPLEEEAYVSRVTTSARRTRSKAPFDSTNRDTATPTRTRGQTRSTASPIRDASQTSPYRLRSQSRQMSPDVLPQSSPVRRSPRRVVRRDTDFDIVPSQLEDRNVFGSMFEPSQELGFGYSQLSQGRYPDVGFVKDSEDGTSHSEASLSTVQYSDPVDVVDDAQATTPRLKPPPLSFSQTQPQTRSRSRSTGQQGVTVSPSQPQFSPRRSPRLTRSTFSATPSPRITRTTRELVQVITADTVDERQASETQRSDHESILHPVLPFEDKGVRSSPPASAQLPQQESNLLTPDDTQQTALEPPVSFQARQPEQSIITPELTQMTSTAATLRSFDMALPGIQTQPAPLSPMPRRSPRHPPIATTNTLSSPALSSPTAPTPTTQPPTPLPIIGLSTPLAYYTPLRDLPFFLNRSSQFHSGSSPDILALVVSPTTAPTRAKSGPRDFSTTLLITDPSVHPASRTVSVFRPHAAALPEAQPGDAILLRAFGVLSARGVPALRSGAESAWCVWRFGKRVWGMGKGPFGEVRAREEVRGPQVERGEGEWAEVGRVRGWWVGVVRGEVEGRGDGGDGGDGDGEDGRGGEEGEEV